MAHTTLVVCTDPLISSFLLNLYFSFSFLWSSAKLSVVEFGICLQLSSNLLNCLSAVYNLNTSTSTYLPTQKRRYCSPTLVALATHGVVISDTRSTRSWHFPPTKIRLQTQHARNCVEMQTVARSSSLHTRNTAPPIVYNRSGESKELITTQRAWNESHVRQLVQVESSTSVLRTSSKLEQRSVKHEQSVLPKYVLPFCGDSVVLLLSHGELTISRYGCVVLIGSTACVSQSEPRRNRSVSDEPLLMLCAFLEVASTARFNEPQVRNRDSRIPLEAVRLSKTDDASLSFLVFV